MEPEGVRIQFTGEVFLLWMAIGLAIVFLGILIVDRLRRGQRQRRHRGSSDGFGENPGLPHQAALAAKELKHLLTRRSHRKERGPDRQPPRRR